MTLTRLRDGVYELPLVTRRIRVIVVQELPQQEQNALLLLFSAREEQVPYGREHYQPRTTEMTSLVYKLIHAYTEDPVMSEALKQFAREVLNEVLENATPKERVSGLSPEDRLDGLTPADRLKGLSKEEMRTLLEALKRELKQDESPAAE